MTPVHSSFSSGSESHFAVDKATVEKLGADEGAFVLDQTVSSRAVRGRTNIAWGWKEL